MYHVPARLNQFTRLVLSQLSQGQLKRMATLKITYRNTTDSDDYTFESTPNHPFTPKCRSDDEKDAMSNPCTTA